MTELIVNKIANSGIITLDLSLYVPKSDSLAVLDISPFLFMEMIIKEKHFRQELQDYNWQVFSGKWVAVYCAADAIIPNWAYMLIAQYIGQAGGHPYFGDLQQLRDHLTVSSIESALSAGDYEDKRVILKGCADISVPASAYMAASRLLLPVVRTLMYGEPCSTVPVYKKR